MDLSRTLAIGFADAHIGCRVSDLFFDDTNWAEFNVIFWKPASLIGKYSPQAINQFPNRIEALTRWVEAGNTLFVISELLSDANTTPIVTSSSLLAGVMFKKSRGRLMEPFGSPHANRMLQPILPALSYEVILSGDRLIPLLRVSSTHGPIQLVSGYRRQGRGFVVFIPPVVPQLFRSFLDLPSALLPEGSEIPQWTFDFLLPQESSARIEVIKTQREISRLQAVVDHHKAEIERLQPLKQLMWASGESFVNAVQHALQELGLKTVEGPHPRADVLAWDGKTVAVIEAKGLEGASKEANLRQAKSWVTDVERALSYTSEERNADSDMKRYADALSHLGVPLDRGEGIPCKGIMVIGTFRKTPLDRRTEPDFADALARACNRSGITAITGLQLLLLIVLARKSKVSYEAIYAKLFSSEGVLEETDWRQVLSVVRDELTSEET